MEELKQTLKQQIIDVLNLEDIKCEDIDNDAPLFGNGLGLDSIDALELIVLLEKDYGIKLSDPTQGKAIFRSINTMAEYISVHRTKISGKQRSTELARSLPSRSDLSK